MKSRLEVLTGIKIESILVLNDYVQIFFEDKSVLNIYNEHQFSEKIDELVGQHIKSIEEEDSYIKLNIGICDHIYVDLKEDAYNGPEALQFNTKNGEIIVWN